jgi:hypothetical protein
MNAARGNMRRELEPRHEPVATAPRDFLVGAVGDNLGKQPICCMRIVAMHGDHPNGDAAELIGRHAAETDKCSRLPRRRCIQHEQQPPRSARG